MKRGEFFNQQGGKALHHGLEEPLPAGRASVVGGSLFFLEGAVFFFGGGLRPFFFFFFWGGGPWVSVGFLRFSGLPCVFLGF